MQFFNSSLALRAAQASQSKNALYAPQAMSQSLERAYFLATLFDDEDQLRFMHQLEAMRIPLQRFKEYEFMGDSVSSQVCAV